MSKVLYVDDNDDNVYMLKMRLELLGDFEVITAEDEISALRRRALGR
jgi:CheY-like chemotaxis protein